MGKTITALLTNPISLINKQAGNIISGIVLTVAGAISGNPALIMIGLSRLASAFQHHPKPPTTESSVRSPTPSRVYGYGIRRLFGKYILYETASDGSAIDVYAFADGQADGIVQHYLNDDKVSIVDVHYASSPPDKRYKSKYSQVVQIHTRLGLATETAFDQVVGYLPGIWTDNHRGDGVVTGAMIAQSVSEKYFIQAYPNGPPVLSLALRLQLVFDPRDEAQSFDDPATWTWTENAVLHFLHYLIVRRNYDYETQILPAITYWIHAADVCDRDQALAGVQTLLTFEATPGGTHIDVSSVSGLATGMSIAVEALGNVTHTETRVVTSISGTTIHFTDGLAYDHPIDSRVWWSTDPANPATEKRYRACVIYEATDEPKAVVDEMLLTFDGWAAPRGDGAIVVYAGEYYEPTITIGPDDIISARVQFFTLDENTINKLVVTYISALHEYAQVECESWLNDDDIAKRGAERSQPFSPQTPSHPQNRRLAKRNMAREQAPVRGTVTTNLGGRRAMGQRYIILSIIDDGASLFEGPAEIVSVKRDFVAGGITFDWVAADPNVDAWNPATEEGEPAPVGNRVAPEPLDMPTITDATASYSEEAADGAPGVTLIVDGTGPDREDLTWYARTKIHDATIWQERSYTDIDPGATVELQTGFVPVNASVDVAIAYGVGDGRVSDWSDTTTVDTSAAAVAPAAPHGLTATGAAGSAGLAWTNPTTANFVAAKVYRNTTSTFGTATLLTTIGGALGSAGSYTDTVAAGTYYYWVTAANAGGAESAPAGPASAVVT